MRGKYGGAQARRILSRMPRRGQQTRNAVRRAQRDTTNELESPQGNYTPPSTDDPPKQWEMTYDDTNTVRVQFNLWRAKGRITNFVVNVQVITADGWMSVERFDCCHGCCHLHVDNDETKSRPILRLDTEHDVKRAFDLVMAEAGARARIIRDKGE